MSFLDKLRKKAEELELEDKAKQVAEAATQAAKQAREMAGEFTAEHRDQIDGYVETASVKIDEKTDHRYSEQITKVKEQLEHGVDLVADGYGPVSASPVEPPAPVDRPTSVHDEGFDAAAGDLPVPSDESLTDTALEDTVLGLDHPPVAPPHHDEPEPEDADPSTVRAPRPPHGAGS